MQDRRGNGGQPSQCEHIGRSEQPLLLVLPEDPSVIRHGRDQEGDRRRGQQQRGLVDVALCPVKLDESHGERQRQEEPEEHLDSQPGDPQFLQEVAEIPVVSFSRRLAVSRFGEMRLLDAPGGTAPMPVRSVIALRGDVSR